jgi:hypothetical protein
MWTQLTTNDKPILMNLSHVNRIVEVPEDQKVRGSQLFISMNEFVLVDQTLSEIMAHLGIEARE